MKRILTLIIMCAFAFAHQNLNAQCGTTVNTGVCYTSGSLQTIYVDVCPDVATDVATITFTAGTKEGCCDEIIAYSGAAGSGTGGTEIYNSSAGGTTFAGIVITGTVPGECISVYIDADGSVDCGSGAGVPASFDVTCATPPPPPPAGGATCADIAPLCSGSAIVFDGTGAATDVATSDPGIDLGCLGTGPRPSWFYFEVETAGDFNLNLDPDPLGSVDYDFALYGPFADLATAQGSCGAGLGAPIDCSFAGGTGSETPSVSGTLVGEVYVLLVSKFGAATANFQLSEAAGTTGTTDCDILSADECPYENESFTVSASVCSGELINFTEDGACVDNGDTNGIGVVPDQASDLDLYYYFDGTQYEAPMGHDPLPTTIEEMFIPAGTNNLYRPTTGTNTISGCGDLSTSLVNETCAPITVTFYVMQYNYDIDSGNGAPSTFGEYTAGLCTPHRHDVVIYPATLSVAVTDDGSSCGTPAVELRAADATVCETLTGAACVTDGDAFNYDLSTTGTATALTMAGAACALPTLTGTITCAGCAAPCNASGTMTWD